MTVFVFRLFCFFLIFCAVMVLTQDMQIFPAVLFSSNDRVPKGVKQFFVTTSDNKQIDVWRLEGSSAVYGATAEPRSEVALIFHGNGATMEGFFGMQTWLSHLGITSYAFDFRGFGRSSGWPTEKGIYRDAEAVWQEILKQEPQAEANFIAVGISIGAGPAAEIASRTEAKTLVMFSPYISIKEALFDRKFLSFLSPFLWYEFPTGEYVKKLKDTCLILAHGDKDTIIKPRHSKELKTMYKGEKEVHLVMHPKAGHNDLFNLTNKEIGKLILQCESSEKISE